MHLAAMSRIRRYIDLRYGVRDLNLPSSLDQTVNVSVSVSVSTLGFSSQFNITELMVTTGDDHLNFFITIIGTHA